MPITDEVESWLREAGFCNYCFISYPHTGQPELDECARRIREDIQRELSYEVEEPEVYMDEGIAPGVEWPEDLRINLCGSVSMVALVMRTYLSHSHHWCGREWAAMDQLGNMRLPDSHVKPIIPVTYRKTELPESVATRQHIDISRQSLLGKRYYNTQEFRSAVRRIVDQIIDIACLIHEKKCRVEVDHFELPKGSAFARINTPPQPAPGRRQ